MKIALLILQMFPAIIAAIKSLEEFLPAEGQGKVRLDVIRQVIEITYEASKEIWPFIEKTIEILVKAANSLGVFGKKAE